METKKVLQEVSLELFKESQTGKYLNHVNFEIFGDEIANREMIRGAIEVSFPPHILMLENYRQRR